MDERELQPETSEGLSLSQMAQPGPDFAAIQDMIAAQTERLRGRANALESEVLSDEELAQQEAQIAGAAGGNPIGQILGMALGAALGAATMGGSRGARIGAGGAADAVLAEKENVQAQLERRLSEIRKRNEKKKEIAREAREEVEEFETTETLKTAREERKAIAKERAEERRNASRERAAVLGRNPELPFTEDDIEKIEGAQDLITELTRIRRRIEDIPESASDWWSIFKADKKSPNSAAQDVIADLEAFAIQAAGEAQPGVLTEKDVAPFRKIAGIRAFADKESFLKSVDRLITKGSQDIVRYAKDARKRNLDPTGYIEGLEKKAKQRLALIPKRGEKRGRQVRIKGVKHVEVLNEDGKVIRYDKVE